MALFGDTPKIYSQKVARWETGAPWGKKKFGGLTLPKKALFLMGECKNIGILG